LLTRCSFDLIKIDQSLVAQLGPGLPAPSWLDGLEPLLRATPLEVIAEGVENEYQADALRAAGVQLAQGHWFAEALTAELFKGYFAHNSPLL
jgi:EAL domain-containing protein (putative c-di-GMP-specific phosphodiesterase class I)